jgi:aryl-alcohol dehydrogenase-like predicted oxidoreductase
MERELLPVLRRHRISFVVYRVLGAEFLGGNFAAGAREGGYAVRR